MKAFQTAAITQSIRQCYQRRLFLPVMYLLLLTVLWFTTPVSQLVFPHALSDRTHFMTLHQNQSRYIQTTLTDLHFTGYTQKVLGYTNGYYYYTFQDDVCIFVLLAPDTCRHGTPSLDHLQVRVRLIRHFEEYDMLTQQLAKDLDWTASGVRSQVPDYLLSEPGFHKLLSLLLLAVYFISGIYALIHLIFCVICIWFPDLSPACQRLGLYGNARQQLAQAEEELASCVQTETDTIFLTANYLILMTDFQTAVLPIQEIRWIYQRTAPHKLIRHPLHIIANRHVHIQCLDVPKADIACILNSIGKTSPEILTGFREKNGKRSGFAGSVRNRTDHK